MTTFDWIAVGLLAFMIGGIATAFFFYLRRSYRAGGWRQVGRDFLIAIIAILVFALANALRQSEIQDIGEAVGKAVSR